MLYYVYNTFNNTNSFRPFISVIGLIKSLEMKSLSKIGQIASGMEILYQEFVPAVCVFVCRG